MFLKNRKIISKIKRSKVTDYAALNDRLRIWTCINVRETVDSCAKGQVLPISVLFMFNCK